MNRRLIAAGLCLSILLTATPALASPLSDKREQARVVKAQIDSLDNKLEIAVEDYNGAAQRYSDLNAKMAAINAHLKKVNKRCSVLQTSLNTRVDDMYREGPLGVIDVLLGAASFEDFASTWDLLNEMNKREAQSVAELRIARADIKRSKKSLEVTRRQARTVYQTMTRRKQVVESQLAERKAKLAGVQKQVQALIAEQQRAEAARWGGNDGNWGDPGNAPRTGVVGIALRYLGRPYHWGASGPGSFDCSGFTMFVYRQVGVSLPHHAASQIGCGKRVSRAYLKPGDLVFFGSPIHHVGLYIGNGRMIHAPGTGDHVRIAPILSDYVGACRP
jgi:peptidoglycan DL-endopeptidase CwlO